MTLITTWFSEGRRAQHPPDLRYPLGMLFDASAGAPVCEVALEYPAPCGRQMDHRCDVCGTLSLVMAAGRPDELYTVRLACKLKRDRHDRHEPCRWTDHQGAAGD